MSTDTTVSVPDPDDGNGKPALPEIRREATVMELAQVVADSRAFPDCRNPAAAAVRILAGREMGVGPIASVIGIRVQAGRVSMDASLIAGVIKRSDRYDYRIPAGEHISDRCTIHFYENNELVGVSVFTMEDAKKAGLASKDTWRAYPRNMLFARALTNGARWYCPAIFGGALYSHEELGYAVDEEGRAVNGDGDSDQLMAGAASPIDLCTRDQRQEIARLVEACGKSMVGFLAELGIKLLDELSCYEADREIKKLTKRMAKMNGGTTATETPRKSATNPEPTKEIREATAPVIDETLNAAQKMIADAQAEGAQPSTPQQRQRILDLAEAIVPTSQSEQRELVCYLLGKYGAQLPGQYRIANLNHLQAEACIEALAAKLKKMKAEAKAEPPFDPNPAPAGS